MFPETLLRTARALAAHCRNGTEAEGLATLYDPACVSVEAAAMPGGGPREFSGLEAIRGKHDWWARTMEVHEAEVGGPFLHGEDRFALVFDIAATNRETGQRMAIREVAVYTLGPDGRIVREEFFHPA